MWLKSNLYRQDSDKPIYIHRFRCADARSVKVWTNSFVPLFHMLRNNLRLVMIPTSQYIELNDRSNASESIDYVPYTLA